MACGPIQGFIDPACCQVLEDLSKESKKPLFETKDAETSIHIKRAPLVAGSDVSGSKKKVSATPQGTAAWIAAAAKLLAEQRKLLFEKFGGAFVILDKFDFGPQLLFALAQRQRTHGDGLSVFISGLLQFNVLMLLCYTLYKF